MTEPFETRIIVVPLIRNAQGQYLICKKPERRGVFPGQWGLPGGGIEPGETMEAVLRREVREEVGLEIEQIHRLFFSDGLHPKFFPNGTQRDIYMIFLIFNCLAKPGQVRLNEEFEDYAWAEPQDLGRYDLNEATFETLRRAGVL